MPSLRIGLLSTLSAVDPRMAPDGITALVLAQMFLSPYFLRSALSSVEPVLFSQRLEDVDGELVATVRPGWSFSDGSPVTADAIAASLTGTPLVAADAAIRADGDRVLFRRTRPNARFDLLLASSYAGIVRSVDGRLMGVGPYMLDDAGSARDLQAARSFRLVANPHFRGKRAHDTLEFRVFSSGAALVEALRAGQVDYTDALSPAQVQELTGAPGVHVVQHPGMSTGILFLHTGRLPDPAVRRALALTVNRYDIAKAAYPMDALRYVASGFFSSVFARGGNVLQSSEREAKQLFALHPAPRTLTLVVPWAQRSYAPDPRALGAALRDQYANVGIAVDVVVPESSKDFYALLERGDYDMVFGGWIPDTANPADFYEALFASRSLITAKDATGNNLSWLQDPSMDRLLAAFRGQATPEAQQAVENRLEELAPAVPILYGADVVAHAATLRVSRTSIGGIQRFDHVESV